MSELENPQLRECFLEPMLDSIIKVLKYRRFNVLFAIFSKNWRKYYLLNVTKNIYLFLKNAEKR